MKEHTSFRETAVEQQKLRWVTHREGTERGQVGDREGELVLLRRTYHTDLRGNQVAQSVEPVDVGLQVTGFTLPEETLKKRQRQTCQKGMHEKRHICVILNHGPVCIWLFFLGQ